MDKNKNMSSYSSIAEAAAAIIFTIHRRDYGGWTCDKGHDINFDSVAPTLARSHVYQIFPGDFRYHTQQITTYTDQKLVKLHGLCTFDDVMEFCNKHDGLFYDLFVNVRFNRTDDPSLTRGELACYSYTIRTREDAEIAQLQTVERSAWLNKQGDYNEFRVFMVKFIAPGIAPKDVHIQPSPKVERLEEFARNIRSFAMSNPLKSYLAAIRHYMLTVRDLPLKQVLETIDEVFPTIEQTLKSSNVSRHRYSESGHPNSQHHIIWFYYKACSYELDRDKYGKRSQFEDCAGTDDRDLARTYKETDWWKN